jgi:hypothetical protein
MGFVRTHQSGIQESSVLRRFQVSRRRAGRGACGALLLLFGVGPCPGQTVTVTADREFDLGSKKIGPVGSGAWLAQPDRLVFVGIGQRAVQIVVATPDGVVQSTSPNIANVYEQIYKATPRPDGNVWVVANGPLAFAGGMVWSICRERPI